MSEYLSVGFRIFGGGVRVERAINLTTEALYIIRYIKGEVGLIDDNLYGCDYCFLGVIMNIYICSIR